MMIQPIVEGQGEVEAVPILLRRFIDVTGLYDKVAVNQPIRWPRDRLIRQPGVIDVINLARRNRPGAILIMFDGDADCPAELGPEVQKWAEAVARDIPCQVVIPHREYEAWFLASVESLRGVRGIKKDARSPRNPEARRGAKEQLAGMMSGHSTYKATIDQPTFSAKFSMDAAYKQCRSFRKMVSAFEVLLRATNHDIGSVASGF